MSIGTRRLKIEFTNLCKEPVPLALAKPLESDILQWRFLIKGIDDYSGGYYFGKIIFPTSYPLSPPSIIFITPSGRFEVLKRVCLSISDFHPETWSPSWTIGTILTGVVSFFNSEEMTTGSINASKSERMRLAAASKAFNLRDKTYCEVFGTDDPELLFQEAESKIRANTLARQNKTSPAPAPVSKAGGGTATASMAPPGEAALKGTSSVPLQAQNPSGADSSSVKVSTGGSASQTPLESAAVVETDTKKKKKKKNKKKNKSVDAGAAIFSGLKISDNDTTTAAIEDVAVDSDDSDDDE